MATVLVIGTMDTKGPESAYLAERIRANGCDTLTLDSGILGEALGITCDFPRAVVAQAAGHSIDQIRNAGSRGKAVEEMLKGVRAIARDLYQQGRIHGLIALGGAEGSVLATAAMKDLPIGIPKLIVSPIASGRRPFDPFIGTKDILVMHSVVDILGLNVIAVPVFDTAAAAIAGMARDFAGRAPGFLQTISGGRRQIAATMLGNTTKPLMRIKKSFESSGFDLVIFHANGVGGPAMEEQIEAGKLHGVIDYTLSEMIGEVAQAGFHRGGPHRMEAAARMGIPQLIVPGCVDFLVCGKKADLPPELRDRPSHYHNPEFTLVRASREEQLQCARLIADKLNAATAPVRVMVPTRGLSVPNIEVDQNGRHGEFWDPEIDAAFRKELRRCLRSGIAYSEHEFHINEADFADLVLETARSLFTA
jgi:uncharacterized protein (UPF0261 family)